MFPPWWHPDLYYPGDNNVPESSFPNPVPAPGVDPDAGTQLTVAYASEWTPVLLAAADQLINPATFQGTIDERLLAQNRAITLKYLLQHPVSEEVPTPYWDDESDIEINETSDSQTWYGTVSDPEAAPAELDFVENALVWAFTGLIAAGTWEVGAAPAILFHTIAPKFLIAAKRGDIGAQIRILLDGEEQVRIDGGSDPDEIVTVACAGNPDLETHELYVIQSAS